MNTQPPEHCYVILQNFGPNGGGWGTATILLPGLGVSGQAVYTGSDRQTIDKFEKAARTLALETGLPTKFVRYRRREDVASFGGSS